MRTKVAPEVGRLDPLGPLSAAGPGGEEGRPPRLEPEERIVRFLHTPEEIEVAREVARCIVAYRGVPKSGKGARKGGARYAHLSAGDDVVRAAELGSEERERLVLLLGLAFAGPDPSIVRRTRRKGET